MLNFVGNTKFMIGKSAISKIPYEMQYYNSSRALIIVDNIGEKYLSKFLKRINNQDITIDVVRVGSDFKVSDVNYAIAEFYATGANAIISLGGASAIEISKGVSFAVAHGQDKFTDIISKTKSVNNISLFMVPTDIGIKNCASKYLMLFDEFGKRMLLTSEKLQANAIIIDPSMTKHIRESEVIEKGMYAVMLCLTAVIDDISIVARGYAIAATCVAREFGYDNYDDKSKQNERRFAAMLASVYAGLASDENKDSLLPLLAMSVSEYANISYIQAYNALALQYMKIYMKEGEVDALGINSFVGIDKALKYNKPVRSMSVLTEMIDKFDVFRREYNQKMLLSDFGLVADDLLKIHEIAIMTKLIPDDDEVKHLIMELLNRSL